METLNESDLELFVDSNGLAGVLSMLVTICRDKAEKKPLQKSWLVDAERIENIIEKLHN